MFGDTQNRGIVLAFLASTSVLAISLVFVGGAVVRESFELGLAMAAVGAGWLGIVYASLTSLASEVHKDSDSLSRDVR